MRKITQIAVSPDTKATFPCLYAVCDDGTVWFMNLERSRGVWEREEPIPQDKESQ
jgi:hypothetical protein